MKLDYAKFLLVVQCLPLLRASHAQAVGLRGGNGSLVHGDEATKDMAVPGEDRSLSSAGSSPVTWYTATSTPAFDSTGGVTWAEADQFCTDQGRKLCSYEELCPNGKDAAPVGNPILGNPAFSGHLDKWAPIDTPGNSCPSNEWVQIGNWASTTPHTCIHHQEIPGVTCPDWGTTKAGTENFQSHIPCCNHNQGAFCWRHTESRLGGGVSLPDTCPAGDVDLKLLCFDDDQKCPEGYHNHLSDCHQSCPEGFWTNGLLCTRYGPFVVTLTPYPWVIGDPLFSAAGQFQRCAADNGNHEGNCMYDGVTGIVYPKCPAHYDYDGLGLCFKSQVDCGAYGMIQSPNFLDGSCGRNIISAFNKKVCKPEQGERSLGLCYKQKCPDGWDSVGPNCWEAPPAGWERCGMGAAPNLGTCAAVTYKQVDSVADLAANVLSVALSIASAGATSGSQFALLIKNFKRLLKVASWVNSAMDATMAQYNTDGDVWTDIFKEDTSTLDKVRIAAQIVSLVDQTGIAAIVGAYTYPKCRDM